MSILITGGTGWVGTGLAHRLVERGERRHIGRTSLRNQSAWRISRIT